MDELKFFELFGEIDADIVQQANDDLNFWQEGQEGVAVQAVSRRRSPLRIVLASVACAAALFCGVFLLRNVLKNGFMYEPPVNSSDSSVQGGENSTESNTKITDDYIKTLNSVIDTSTDVDALNSSIKGAGGDDRVLKVQVFEHPDAFEQNVVYSAGELKDGAIVLVDFNDGTHYITSRGERTTEPVPVPMMFSHIIRRAGSVEQLKEEIDGYNRGLGDRALTKITLYQNGEDAANGSDNGVTLLENGKIVASDEDFKSGEVARAEYNGGESWIEFSLIGAKIRDNGNSSESMSNPLSRAECEDIVALFNDWADLNYNIHPYHKINEVYIFPECVDESAFITEEVTRKGSTMTYTEYFYLIKSGEFSGEVEFDRKIGEMFSEKFGEQYMGSSSWQDFRFKDGKTFVAAFSQFEEEQPQMLLYIDLESIDENTVVLNVGNVRGSYEQKYTATLLRSENGGFKIDEVGKDDGSFNGIPWLFHYKNIQVAVNWQDETLFTFGDDLSASGGEPMFFVGPDGKAILTSEVTRLDYTDKTAETLTEEDYGAMVYCDGFAYFMEPCGIGYDNYNNPELFDGIDFIGEVPENKNEWKRAYVGDEILGLKVKSAYSEFYIHDPSLPPYTGYHFTNSVFEFEGTLEVEGFLDIRKNYGDPNIDGQMYLFAPTADIPLAPVYPYASGEEMYAARFEERRVHDPGDKYVCAGEHYTIQLGQLADVSCDLDGMGAGDIAYVRVTLNNIRCFENVVFATVDKVERLSDILAHDE